MDYSPSRYVTFSCEFDDPVPVDIRTKTGIDVGLSSLITLSNGEQVKPPKFLRESEHKLKREQKRLSPKKFRSGKRTKQKIIHAHLFISNKQYSFSGIMSISSKLHSRSHPAIFLVAIGIAIIMISPFITPLILAAITTYILRPIVKKIEPNKLLSHLAIGLLTFIIALPIAFAFSYLSTNAGGIFEDIAGLTDKITTISSSFSDLISAAGLGTYTNLPVSASEIAASVTSIVLGLVSDLLTSIPMLLLDFVIFLYATYYFMSYGHNAIDSVRSYASTLQKEDEQFISSIMAGLKKSFDVLVMSYITMSFIVFVLSLVGYNIFGVPHAFILAILTGLFGFLPVFGTWMVYVPAAAYMYFSGNTFSAVGVFAFGFIVLTVFLPMVLQPYLGSKQSDVNPLTIFLGFFSGPIIFGAKGVLLGPIILVVVHTIIYEYMAFRIESERNAMEYAD